jgi:hypothetical protein
LIFQWIGMMEYSTFPAAVHWGFLPATRLAGRKILIEQKIIKRTGPALYVLCGYSKRYLLQVSCNFIFKYELSLDNLHTYIQWSFELYSSSRTNIQYTSTVHALSILYSTRCLITLLNFLGYYFSRIINTTFSDPK